MRRFLFLALGLGMMLPTAANAESYWLILKFVNDKGSGTSASLEKIEMTDMNQCNQQGKYWQSKKPNRFEALDYVCITGK